MVILQAGDKIPADLRLLEVTDFSVNEAALTGESDAVQKDASAEVSANAVIADRINLAFAGTVAIKGSAVAVVTQTAQHTEVGQIAQLIKETKEADTPLQAQLSNFAKKISIAVIGIAVSIFLFGFFVQHNLVEMFTVAVAVAVSAIP
ncbi:MAG: ATPase, P-type (transporting), HAD superfamily, subfamily IC, partial [uncultured bacterium]